MFYTALKKNPLDSYRLLKNVSYLTHTPPLIRISPLYTELPPIFSQTFLWVVYRAQLPQFFLLARLQGGATANFLADVSVGRSQGAAIATFLGAVSVGRLQGAATANFLPDVSVGDLQGAAIANFLVDDINPKSIGHQFKMIQNRFKNNKKWLLQRTNISAKSIGQQPKLI